MAKKRKHSTREIIALLAQADNLAGQGKLQPEIARTLGVSVMTLHRWRKIARIGGAPKGRSGDEPKRGDRPIWPGKQRGQSYRRARAGKLELRKLVTDLLLEKMRLEEEAKGQIPGGNPIASNRARPSQSFVVGRCAIDDRLLFADARLTTVAISDF